MSDFTILIADDDRDLVRALAVRCQQLGLRVLTSHGGLQTLNLAQAARPDLLCLDMDMPGGNGLSVCEMLAADEVLSKRPVIILTGCMDQQIMRRCHDLCAYFVPKCCDSWSRLEPLICELLSLDTAPSPR